MSNSWSNDPNWRSGYEGQRNDASTYQDSWMHEQGRLARIAQQDAQFRDAWCASEPSAPPYASSASWNQSDSNHSSTPSNNGNEGLGILFFCLPVVGPGAVSGISLGSSMVKTGWSDVFAWVTGILVFIFITGFIIVLFAKLPIKLVAVVGGFLGLAFAAISVRGFEPLWTVVLTLLSIAAGAGWLLTLSIACETFVSGDRWNFPSFFPSLQKLIANPVIHGLAWYAALAGLVLLQANTFDTQGGFYIVLSAAVLLSVLASLYALRKFDAGFSYVGVAVLPVAVASALWSANMLTVEALKSNPFLYTSLPSTSLILPAAAVMVSLIAAAPALALSTRVAKKIRRKTEPDAMRRKRLATALSLPIMLLAAHIVVSTGFAHGLLLDRTLRPSELADQGADRTLPKIHTVRDNINGESPKRPLDSVNDDKDKPLGDAPVERAWLPQFVAQDMITHLATNTAKIDAQASPMETLPPPIDPAAR